MLTGIAEIDIIIIIVVGIFWIFDQVFNDGKFFASEEDSSEEKDAEPATGYSPDDPLGRQRKQMENCAMDNCNSLSFRNTDYCWKHQDGKPHVTDGPSCWEEGGGSR